MRRVGATLVRAYRCLGRLSVLTTPALSLAVAVWVTGAPPVAAASVPVSFTVQVSAVDPGVTAIAVGDRFTINFTVDDSTVDTNNSVGAGTFPGLLTSFTMTADPGNTGTWTPSGTFNLPASNFVTNAFGDNFTFQVVGSGFPNGGTGMTFLDIDLGFAWPSDLTDSGLGDTFAQQLAPQTFGVPPATLSSGAGIRFQIPGVNIFTAHIAQVQAGPEGIPMAGLLGLALLALALGILAWYRLR